MKKIYVRVSNEAVDVWRPVDAEQISSNQFLISIKNVVPDEEEWEFCPGSKVFVESKMSDGEMILIAVSLVN